MHSQERITEALQFIPSDNREIWIRMAMSVKSELGDDGFDIWDNWSSQGDTYSPRDTRDVWKSIDSTGLVTVGTLFHIAKVNGWIDNGKHPKPSAAEIQERQRQAAERVAKRKAELERQHTVAAQRANETLTKARPAEATHPYLLKKQILPHGAMQRRTSLVLPVTDFDGCLWSVQFIHADGSKLLLKSGKKKGCHIVVDGPASPSRVIICEGWATGCTLAEDEPESLVWAAIDAGNLLVVAKLVSAKWPGAELIIAGDDDRLVKGNPGRTKATDCAVTVGALLAFPEWPEGSPDSLTDFNDLACYQAGGAA